MRQEMNAVDEEYMTYQQFQFHHVANNKLLLLHALVLFPKLRRVDQVLLLLDEAMSALDNESEAEVLSALNDLRMQMGILLIAHRLSAVRNADFIGVLEAGRLVEYGSWDDLVARRERLHALIEAQAT